MARDTGQPSNSNSSGSEAALPFSPSPKRDLRSLLRTYINRHWPKEALEQEHRLGPGPSPAPTAMRLLCLVPWGLGLLFLFSFVWDFNGMHIEPFGHRLVLDGLLLTVSVSGLIGFFTNWLAITMLFHPRRRRPILGQGVIPAQRDRVILRLAKAVSDQLINEQTIKEQIESSGVVPRYRAIVLSVTHNVLTDPEFRTEIKAVAGEYVEGILGSELVRGKIVDLTLQKLEEFSQSGIGGLALKAYRLFQEDKLRRLVENAVQDLPRSVDVMLDQIDELLDDLPERLAERSADMEEWATKAILGFVRSLDIYAMIVDNMQRYDEYQLEALIKNSSNDQLNYIKYLGGAIGTVGGLVIFDKWVAIPMLAVLIAGLVLLDFMLYRLLTPAAEA